MGVVNQEGRFQQAVRKVTYVLRALGIPYLWYCQIYARYLGGFYKLYSPRQSVSFHIPSFDPKHHLRFMGGVDWKRFDASNLYPAMYAEKKRSGKKSINIIEVGSSWGEEILYLSELASGGKVYCFEPHPASYACLARNVTGAGLTNVEPRHAAVGRQNGWIVAHRGRIWARNHVDASEGDGIPVYSLDELFRDQNVDIIKIDTDGYDIEVVEGAMDLIRRSQATVFVEFLTTINYRGLIGVEVLKRYSEMGFKIRHPQLGDWVIKEEEFTEFLMLLDSRHASVCHDIILRLD